MGLFDIIKPKWQHSDAKVRLEGIAELDMSELDILCEIATNDTDDNVKIAAIKKINCCDSLHKIAASNPNPKILEFVEYKSDAANISH